YTMLRSRGDDRFIAIPVFPSRTFRHSGIYINKNSGIQSPEDLKGKRIGVGDYQMTAAVWVRGLLQDDFNVHPKDMTWVTGTAVQDYQVPPGITVENCDNDNPETLLYNGEIDALISVMIPKQLNNKDSDVIRLFPDYKQIEMEYFQRTGVFPIMHTLVIKTGLFTSHPWLAISLYKAFIEAKNKCYRYLYNTDALTTTLPWVVNEMEDTRNLMGNDFWDYSIDGSRPTLETLMRYLHEQGLTETQMRVKDLFVENINSGMSSYLHGTSEDTSVSAK
ncbi:MAG: ABC transporter substrate-binding protein, partial [Gammaproteobacteria bacterium]|nr:ABC transporter substrate-binding protein [Gammaproteobacteria bacterium]